MSFKNWPLASVTASTATDFVVPTSNKEVAVISIYVCNIEATNSSNVTITLTNSANTILSTLFKGDIAAGDTITLDSKIFIAASATPNKLRVLSTMANVSFTASGDES